MSLRHGRSSRKNRSRVVALALAAFFLFVFASEGRAQQTPTATGDHNGATAAARDKGHVDTGKAKNVPDQLNESSATDCDVNSLPAACATGYAKQGRDAFGPQ